jgi:hypothetical protein
MGNIERSSHPRIYAHTTINALNWREMPQLVRTLQGRVRGITVQFHYPYDELDDDLVLSRDQRRQVIDTLIDLKGEGLALANSYACLRALRDNDWTCRPWLIASIDPDGRTTHGCYLQGRGTIACERCGFSAHTEISLAYGGTIDALIVAIAE